MENKATIAGIFSRIARRYDLANDLLSLGIHRLWKRKALKILNPQPRERFLDLCCGTGDFLVKTGFGIGLDVSGSMLLEAQKRVSTPLLCADGESLPFKDQSLNKVIIGFGIRNIPQFEKALSEIQRGLTPGGKLVILEFSRPRGKILSRIYFLYLNKILPAIGGWVSKNPQAYHYLARTIQTFPDGSEFLALMEKADFKNLEIKKLFLGIASIYIGEKKA